VDLDGSGSDWDQGREAQGRDQDVVQLGREALALAQDLVEDLVRSVLLDRCRIYISLVETSASERTSFEHSDASLNSHDYSLSCTQPCHFLTCPYS